ncbi:hypothetical protein HPB47_019692 [Ixodes persulcatus]|uniref:Uncharacterized protein n=1 Tax=Ixodes persulcatus TaxID=34615 RepID=A0AC60QHF3_IXOPE|nr:hypothetical protein HPB47_019692 [Ixodes persulcatus]
MRVEWCRHVPEDGSATWLILISVVVGVMDATDDRHQCSVIRERRDVDVGLLKDPKDLSVRVYFKYAPLVSDDVCIPCEIRDVRVLDNLLDDVEHSIEKKAHQQEDKRRCCGGKFFCGIFDWYLPSSRPRQPTGPGVLPTANHLGFPFAEETSGGHTPAASITFIWRFFEPGVMEAWTQHMNILLLGSPRDKLRPPPGNFALSAPAIRSPTGNHQEWRRARTARGRPGRLAREALIRALREAAEEEPPEKFQGQRLWAVAREAISGADYLRPINDYIRDVFFLDQRRSPPQSSRRTLPRESRRRRRRREYSKTQEMFHRRPADCAREVLDGPAEAGVEDVRGFLSTWAGIMTGPLPPPIVEPLAKPDEEVDIFYPVTAKELREARLPLNSAPGPDGFTARLLRAVPSTILRVLLTC